MDIHFEFTATPNIIFGIEKIVTLPIFIHQYGTRALIVVGNSSFMKSFSSIELIQDLESMKIEHFIVTVDGEPSPKQIDNICNVYRSWKPKVVVAIGGGSVIDAGKAISAMLCEKGSITDYLEGVGTKSPSGLKIPFIAVPTTAGTGSEATKNAVISVQGKDGFKKSLRHNNYIPNLAIIDPELTMSCPSNITAASGMDAFTQLLESYVSINSNVMTDTLALNGLEKLIGSIETAVAKGYNLIARSDMSYAAMLSGITLANAGLGVVHGFAQPLGSLFSIPHGVVCGTLMGAANRITVHRLRENKNKDTLKKYHKVAQLENHISDETKSINEFLDYLDYLTEKFNLPLLSEFGIKVSDLPSIIAKTDLKNHPVELSHEDLEWILKLRL